MTTTPEKSIDSSSPKLTPVRFLDSPKGKYTTGDSNANAVKERLETAIKTLQDNYSKWQLAQKRGLAICNAIEAIKTKVIALESSNRSATDDFTIYPAELKPYCDKLAIITTIFTDISANAQLTLRQMQSLARLPGCSNEIFFRSWQMEQFLHFMEYLVEKYTMESAVKRAVMEELPHCLDRAQLIRSTTAWEYPQHVDESVALKFKFLAEEININKK